MRRIGTLLLVLTFICCLQNVSAQEMSAKKYDNPQWYVIEYLDFYSGKADDAKKIIEDYFVPADEDAGVPGPLMELNMVSGQWDYMVVWHLDEGVESLDWEVSPNSIKWRQAFEKKAGSKEKAQEIRDEFSSYIRSSKSELARRSGK